MSASVLIPGISHSLQFMRVLQEIGVVKRGSFVWATVEHDSECVALHTNNISHCYCCPHIVIDGDTYSFDQQTGEVWVSRAVQQ